MEDKRCAPLRLQPAVPADGVLAEYALGYIVCVALSPEIAPAR
jgi:hypothetical protein